MAEVRINLTPDPAFNEVAQLAERLAYQSKAENRDLTDDELKTLHAAIDKYEAKMQGKVKQQEEPAVLSEAEVNELTSTVELDFQSLAKTRENQRLRHLNIDTKATDLAQEDQSQDNGREM